MKRKIFLVALMLSVFVGSAQAFERPGLSAFKNVANTVTTVASSLTPSGVSNSINDINTKLSEADKSVMEAFDALVVALSSKEEATKIKAELSAINSNSDLSETEKSAKIAEVLTDYGTTLKETKAAKAEQLRTANDEKKVAIQSATDDLLNATSQYLDIAVSCKNLVASVAADPVLAVSMAADLGNLKDTGIVLKNNVVSLKEVTLQAVSIAKAGGVDIELKDNKSSKAKKVDF